MKKSIYKRTLAAALSLIMAVSLAACGQKNDVTPLEETQMQTTAATADTEAADTEETAPVFNEGDSFFGENYNPLDDSYDPYAGGAAVTDVHTSVKLQDGGDNSSDGTQASAAQSPAQTMPTAAPSSHNSNNTAADTTAATAAKNDSKPAETTAAKKSDGEKSSDKSEAAEAQLIVSVPNGWNDGTSDFSQIDGTVKNNGKTNIESWTATIIVGSNASIEQSWNCGLSIKDGTITVTPVDYNTTVSPGSEATFGFILKNPGKVDTEKSELKCTAGTYSATNGNYSGDGTPPGAPVYAKDVPEPTTDDWLSVKGNKIVDKNGKEVWITGINWFGYNTGTNTFDGLWTCDLNTSLAAIADHGFNLLRVPISAELINNWAAGNYPTANFNQATNSYLVGMTSLEIFDYVIGQCRANGLKIMIDIHSAKTDSMGHMKNMWYEGNVTEKDYLAALSWMAGRYKNDDTIIAYDLKNEPHGKAFEAPRAKWDNSKDADNWKYIAEKAANAVLSENPNVLVMVEGIEIYPIDLDKNGDFSSTNAGDYYSTWWGGNLRGVKDNPVDLGKYQNKLVYSPHDYGPAVYQQEWFKGDYTYESLYKDAWHDNWLYIQEDGTAPLLIGEWGGFMTQPNLKWMTYLRQLIKEKKINHTFWCFNANSGDTGGLVKDDFVTWDNEKYEFVKEVLWQKDGKFVGLDHEIPLGSNGTTLS